MLAQAADFQTEAEELYSLLLTLRDSDWQRATLFKDWTIDDILQHLHEGDLMAAASVQGADPFTQMRAEMQSLRDAGMSRLQATRHRMKGVGGSRLREHWHDAAIDLARQLSALPVDRRLKWAGPDMGVRMFTTARQMETWAHGQAIYDLMGVERTPSDRLRNIAELGVRTYGWTFANRGLPLPGPAPCVRLSGPSGSIWLWHDEAAGSSIEGDALAFCQVVTQVRNIADTSLQVRGEPARRWMSLAQCFAGPPETPPAAGSRSMARRAAGGGL